MCTKQRDVQKYCMVRGEICRECYKSCEGTCDLADAMVWVNWVLGGLDLVMVAVTAGMSLLAAPEAMAARVEAEVILEEAMELPEVEEFFRGGIILGEDEADIAPFVQNSVADVVGGEQDLTINYEFNTVAEEFRDIPTDVLPADMEEHFTPMITGTRPMLSFQANDANFMQTAANPDMNYVMRSGVRESKHDIVLGEHKIEAGSKLGFTDFLKLAKLDQVYEAFPEFAKPAKQAWEVFEDCPKGVNPVAWTENFLNVVHPDGKPWMPFNWMPPVDWQPAAAAPAAVQAAALAGADCTDACAAACLDAQIQPVSRKAKTWCAKTGQEICTKFCS